ncbi:helix-turn-helix transcriptional regulator [Silvania hatchlandensis]|uniref:Helix-turn-helix domain-containing protein n=1 Tax=Silvania hatchlandensis TaxID=2926469 RepID=A0A9J6Q6I7_9ENTR|nr:helix-turn-helix transcriptional regulator [Silvania hatchlandensis]MCU6665150.1 helix-turn-helix domain-containing protein [Silvania hatchlandensis]
MKAGDKKESELKSTLARLRTRNQQTKAMTESASPDKEASSSLSRQRVSPSLTRVSTVDRQSVMHSVIRDILLGQISQGQALKKLRVDVLGLRQDEYARLVKVSRKTLSDVENDKGNYSTEVVNKIYKPFGLETGLVPVSKTLIAALLA